jgi:hypothetical protein
MHIEEGRELLLGLGHRRVFWLELDDDMWGPHVREGERKNGYRFGNGQMGHGLILLLGRIVTRGSKFIFLFSFLLFFFLIS